jgi:flagellar protein FliS
MATSIAAKTYSDLGAANSVEDRKPEELIKLLLEKACVSLRRALLILENQEMESENWQTRLKSTETFQLSISKALQIVTALREILDYDEGGDLARQLESTYTSIMSALWKSSKERDVSGIKKILAALAELKDAWETISKQ